MERSDAIKKAKDYIEQRHCKYVCKNWFDGFCADKDCGIHEWLEALSEEPIKHGRWVIDTNYETYNVFGEVYKCNQCGYEIGWRDYSEMHKRYYCPHCGAKMDEETEQK